MTLGQGKPPTQGGPALAPYHPTAALNLSDDLLWRKVLQAPLQCDETVMAEILVQVRGIEVAAMLGGDMFLWTKELGHRWVADFDRMTTVVPPDPLMSHYVE